MVSILNRYVPGRVFVLAVAENALIAASICGVMSLHLWQNPAEDWLASDVLLIGVVVALVCQVTFYYFNLYHLHSIASRRALVGRLLSACGVCCLALALCAVIFPSLRIGAGIMEVTFTCVVLLILVTRLFLEWINRWIASGDRILVIGDADEAASIVQEIRARSDLNLVLLGVVGDSEAETRACGSKHLGSLAELAGILELCKPDRIVLAVHDRQEHLPLDLLLSYRSRGVRIEEAATLFEKLTGRIPIEDITARTLLLSEGFKKQNIFERVMSRGLAILLAVIALVICAPLMLLVAALIRLESKGPILFRQERVGKDGAVFDIIKFRSMQVDAEESAGPQWASVNDPRITRVGSIIRKLRIDELPQFVNVLVGDMSLVGPRPERPYFVEQLKQRVPYYDLRHSIRPGLTGWAQVSFPYGSSYEDVRLKLEFDLFYVKNASFALDLAILFETVRTVLLGQGR